MLNPHAKSKKEIFKELNSSEKGLTNSEAKNSLQKYGSNIIRKKKQTPLIFKFLKQFKSPLIYILLVAMIISFVFDHVIDAYVILTVVLINAIIGFIQERKAETAINALKKMIVSYAKVLRSNNVLKLPASELVPGDIILLEEGDKVPADAYLIDIKNLRTQESSLTGESFPIDKKLGVLEEKFPLGDRTNMVFMGTLVVSGTAKAIVVSTGDKTSIGKVAESIREIVQPRMHFQEKVSQLAFQMALLAIIGASLTFIIGYFIRGLEFFEIFLFTIASLVSGIPEGLPAVLIIVLAIGASRMAKRNAIIRHLPAVETLGVATVIATDKTGTLTSNSMNIEQILTLEGNFKVTGKGWVPKGDFYQDKEKINPLKNLTLKKLLYISAISPRGNLLKNKDKYEIVGDPTEVALLVLSKKAGIEKQELSEKQIDELAFSSELKFKANLIQNKNKKQIYSVGAFEKILERSSFYLANNKKVKLDEKTKKDLLKKAVNLAKKGLRILAVCYKDTSSEKNKVSKEDINEMVFVGLVGMKDSPRQGIKEAIQKARSAGIRVIMKTGDHKETALAIAKEIGLVDSKSKILTQTDLQQMSELEFKKAVKEIDLFARVTPTMKMKIIKELQEQGELVAMTGDGVNDAPALKRSDIGISMGIIGTDVARESSEMILADDNFASIVNAVEEGRTVFRNLKRTSFFLVTTNVAEDVTIVSSLVMGLPLPMIPIQILYLNLVTDTFPGIALAAEPSHEDVLSNPPRNKKERILNKDVLGFLVLTAGLMTLGTLYLFTHFLSQGIGKARTIAFVSMSMFQLFNAFNMRSIKKSLFKIGIFSNKWLIGGITISFLMMLGIIYLPWIRGIFQFVHLTFNEFLLISLIASSVFIFGELYKFFHKKQTI